MNGSTTCPGCGLRLPASGWTVNGGLHASPECWQVHGEVVGFEMSHADLVRRFHQLTVDAYGAQHAGGPTPRITVAYALVGLYLTLERGMTGLDVRGVHQRMGRPDASWPTFVPPEQAGGLTVLDVAEAGARAASAEGHTDLVQQ